MDKDNKIILSMMKDAKEKMLCAEKWEKYGCESKEDSEAYIEALSVSGLIRKIPPAQTVLTTRGHRDIAFMEAALYVITRPDGEAHLQQLLSEKI